MQHVNEQLNILSLFIQKNQDFYEKKFKKYHIDLDKIEIRTTSQKESICGGNKNEL